MTKYIIEKENHTGDIVTMEVSSDKLFEMSGSPHVKRLNVLEKYEGKKMVQQNYDSTTHEITKKGLKPIKVVVEKVEEI